MQEESVLFIGGTEAAHDMRRWAIPLTVLGIGGLAAMLLTRHGRVTVSAAIDDMVESLGHAEAHLEQFGEDVQRELEDIQHAVDHIAENLGVKDSPKARI